MADAPRVFISYSHDSTEHADHVLALAYALCDDGIDVTFDRYVHPAPAEGWPRWMERNLDEAQFVLMVCTKTYRRRVLGREEPGKGLGVHWEGNLIYNRIYHDPPSGSRFIPILLPGSEPAHIPNPVQGHSYYRLARFDLTDPGFEALYRHLTDQPATPRPDRGPIAILPPRPRPQTVRGPLFPKTRSPLHRWLLRGAVVGALALLPVTLVPIWTGNAPPETVKDPVVTPSPKTRPLTGAEEFYRRAGEYVDKKDWVQAIKHYTEAIRLDPKSAAAYTGRGQAWSDKKEYDKAIADYTEAIRLDPKSAAAYTGRGQAWSDKKEDDQAIADFDEAIRLDPKSAAAYTGRGFACTWSDKKKYDQAIADYTEAIRLDPKSAAAYLGRGFARHCKQAYDRAIADYTEAIRLDPKLAIAYTYRGVAWCSKKEYDKAFADFDEAIRLDPKSTLAYTYRGQAWSDKEEYVKAIADYTEAIRLDPTSTLAYTYRGVAWYGRQAYDRAKADFDEVIRLDPKSAAADTIRALKPALEAKSPQRTPAYALPPPAYRYP